MVVSPIHRSSLGSELDGLFPLNGVCDLAHSCKYGSSSLWWSRLRCFPSGVLLLNFLYGCIAVAGLSVRRHWIQCFRAADFFCCENQKLRQNTLSFDRPVIAPPLFIRSLPSLSQAQQHSLEKVAYA